jgi:alkylation response protein AidB-like acyl-CoA dehydrogenase
MTMQNELYDSIDKLLTDLDVPREVRILNEQLLSGPGHALNTQKLWDALQSSGFLDVLVPEHVGGAGLGWSSAWQVLFAAGRHGLPLPVGATLYARAVMADLKAQPRREIITMSGFVQHGPDGVMLVRDLPAARLATHAMVQDHDTIYLLPLSEAMLTDVGGPGCFDAQASWARSVVNQSVMATAPRDLLTPGLALALAAQIAGAADRAMALTLQHANQRTQFGKPIGKFQAVQQQLAQMAEWVFSARMASQIGAQSEDWQVAALPAAIAKTQTSAVAPAIAEVAHAVHAAIGITAEYDLQIYTRRLYEWARLGGGEPYWAQHIGQQAISGGQLLDFMRQGVFQEV